MGGDAGAGMVPANSALNADEGLPCCCGSVSQVVQMYMF